VGWGCVVESGCCIVVASLLSAMVSVWPDVVVVFKVVFKVVIVASSSLVGIVSVIIFRGGLSSGLGIVASVVGEVQRAGVSLHVRVTTC